MSMGCDVRGCERETYMCWRPLSVSIGRQVCEHHWDRHKDLQDKFDLHDVFNFPRYQIRRDTSLSGSKLRRCICGAEREPNHKYCEKCAKERERQRKQEYRLRKTGKQQHIIEQSEFERIALQCKDCGRERLPGHTYCKKCGKRRKKKSNRCRQQKYRKRAC